MLLVTGTVEVPFLLQVPDWDVGLSVQQLSGQRWCFAIPEDFSVPGMCLSKQCMHVNQPVFMISLFQGAVVAGWRFLCSESGKQAATTGGVNRGRAEQPGVPDEGGQLGASSSILWRPRLCFKLLQA